MAPEVTAPARPVHVLELRSVRGTGGGPEKTILKGAAQASPGVAVTVCYLRDARDPVFGIDRRASSEGVDYVEVLERHSLDPSIWRPLHDLVRSRAIDVVHSHEYKTDLLAWLLSRSTGAVPLATAHGWTGHTWRERLVYYPADKRLLGRFPLVVAVSSEVKADLVAHGCRPERVRVLLNGIDHTSFRRDLPRVPEARARFGVADGRFAIGAVGRLEPQKRFDLLIEAFATLRQAHPSAQLLIAGDGSLKQALQTQIDARDLSSCCRLLGHVDDVPLLHHALDLFVQSSAYEGTPNVVLEAMALETPIVATDVGGTAELVTHGAEGLIVASSDVDALTAAIQTAIAGGEATRARAAAARRRVETDLSFESRLRALESIYRELAEARRQS
jgi:glycosyltransferase involved in cell wall biosynthesis